MTIKNPEVEEAKIIIALDGNSSCGKSTYAKLIAGDLGYSYIDTGAMYRAVTLACMEAGLFSNTDSPAMDLVEEVLENIKLGLEYNSGKGRTEIYLNGRMVEDKIRSMELSGHVSYIATISSVRRKMVEYQRRLGVHKSLVMDGRDIGTVVFPEAELKIFLTASPEIRAKRRYKELIEKGMSTSLEEVRDNLNKRDHIDSTREDSPLKKAEDAILLDNSEMNLEQQMEWFRNRYRETLKKLDGNR